MMNCSAADLDSVGLIVIAPSAVFKITGDLSKPLPTTLSMGKLPTNEDLKEMWHKEKIARKHEDAAELMYDALQQIRTWFGSHVIVTTEDMTQASEIRGNNCESGPREGRRRAATFTPSL